MTDEKATEKPTQDMPKTNKDAIRSKTATYEILKHEAKVFKCMNWWARIFWDLRHENPHRKFSMTTSIRGAEQTVAGIRDLHTCGFIHRDIKPTNFVIGREQDGDLHTIFIIDFGSSRRYRTIDKDLRYQREKVAFRGTTQYASVSALEMEEQSRKDDIESWWYMVLEWMIGKLPWRHYKLLMDTPQTYMANILLYIDTLEYASIPDYNHIAAQLSASMKAYHLDYDDPPDWDTRGSYIGPRYEDAPSYVIKCKSLSMEYLLDRYFFRNLPFEVTPETRKTVGQRALTLIQWADWLCKYESPVKIFQNNPYFVLLEIVFLFLCLLTFLHAFRHGGRYLYAWIGITVFAFNIECLSVSIPELNVSWHAQGVLSFFGMRVPLYALFGIHQTFGYIAYVLVSRMHLPWWAEGPGVGVSSIMLLFPYRILGTKLLWWTWHDTDPALKDRVFWTPWGLFYFYAASICSFVWILHLLRHILLEREYDWMKFPREFLCSFFAGILSFWLGSVQFSLLYCPLHDLFGVHSEIATILFLSSYALIVIIADRNNPNTEARNGSRFWFDELLCAVALEYLFLGVLVIIAEPLNIVSEGLHQPIGPCNEMEEVRTPNLVLKREKYLCATVYEEKYFDFHCIPSGIPKQLADGSGGLLPLEYYPVCGTAFDNRAEYITVIWGCCVIFGLIFHQIAAFSGSTPIDPIKVRRLVSRNPSSSQCKESDQKTPKLSEEIYHTLVPPAHGVHMTTLHSQHYFSPESVKSRATAVATLEKKTSRRKITEIPASTRVLRSRSYV